MSVLSIAVDGVLAVLLATVIFFAVRLNGRLAQMRDREAEMRHLIASFNRAAVQAGSSAASLKTVGGNAERSLRAAVDKAQALRDELAFIVERGEGVAAKLTQPAAPRPVAAKAAPARKRPPQPAVAPPALHPDDDDLDLFDDGPDEHAAASASRAERDLVKAMLSATGKGGR